MITTVPVSELKDGDVFSLDGLTWYVALVPQFGTVAVYASQRRDAEAPTIRIEAAPDQQVLRLGVETGRVWVLHYWFQQEHRITLHREHTGAIAHLATIVRPRWYRITNRQVADQYPEPPVADAAAVNIYFAGLATDEPEDYELWEEPIQPRILSFATDDDVEYVQGHRGMEWVCPCGNDPVLDGFQPCTARGELIPAGNTGVWDGIHHLCMSCHRTIAQPDGRVARPPQRPT